MSSELYGPVGIANAIADLQERVGGRMLGSAEITTNATFNTTEDDIVGLELILTIGVHPICLEFFCRGVSNDTANGSAVISIKEGATVLYQWDPFLTAHSANFRTGGGVKTPPLTPTPGVHTYKVTGITSAGTGTLVAEATSPAHLRAVEL